MFASILIIIFSVALLTYWFRYSCLLLLRSTEAESKGVIDKRFSFDQVRARLDDTTELDPLHQALSRDYQMLVYLLEHATGLELQSFENRLLVLDYRVMQWQYRLTRTVAPEQARSALKEMASVIGVLAGKLNQRAAAHTTA
jgi:hypothetical protein